MLAFVLLLPLPGLAQDQIIGSWQGKMKSDRGNYVFTLQISPNYGKRARRLKAVAMHTRNGVKEFIELTGIHYTDDSIYFCNKGNLQQQVDEGLGFSRLQFLLKFNRGEPVLDGHWQEYSDLRHYRKGRLLLRRHVQKA